MSWKNKSDYEIKKFKLGGFARLLFCWKASVYKLLWREMLVFLFVYSVISALYRTVFPRFGDVKVIFEFMAVYAYKYTAVFPISFVLGFYVTVVFDRWWMQFKAIPWPDRIVNNVSAHIQGTDERSRLIRRTLVRYINLSAIMIYRLGSKRVKKRFPTFQHLVEAGVLTSAEKEILKNLPTTNPKYWVPCTWFVNLTRIAKQEGRIESDPAMKTIIDELNNFQNKCDELYGFDWIIVPLVYTQVVTIATYSYFAACTVGRQYLDPSQELEGNTFDFYFPGFTVLEFVFYVGWLKVAENLMNPFGEDDDDFDMNWIVDRNIEVSFLAVDELYGKDIPLEPDPHIEYPLVDLPYTNASVKKKGKAWQGSASKVRLSRKDMVFTTMPGKIFTEEDEVVTCMLQRTNQAQSQSNEDENGENDIEDNVPNPPPYSEIDGHLTENKVDPFARQKRGVRRMKGNRKREGNEGKAQPKQVRYEDTVDEDQKDQSDHHNEHTEKEDIRVKEILNDLGRNEKDAQQSERKVEERRGSHIDPRRDFKNETRNEKSNDLRSDLLCEPKRDPNCELRRHSASRVDLYGDQKRATHCEPSRETFPESKRDLHLDLRHDSKSDLRLDTDPRYDIQHNAIRDSQNDIRGDRQNESRRNVQGDQRCDAPTNTRNNGRGGIRQGNNGDSGRYYESQDPRESPVSKRASRSTQSRRKLPTHTTLLKNNDRGNGRSAERDRNERRYERPSDRSADAGRDSGRERSYERYQERDHERFQERFHERDDVEGTRNPRNEEYYEHHGERRRHDSEDSEYNMLSYCEEIDIDKLNESVL